jgi:PAS domain S-box-containing protein
MNQQKKGVSIFIRLLLSFLGVVILVSSTLTTVFYVYDKHSLKKHTVEQIQQQFEAVDFHLRFEMQEKLLNDLRLLSSNPTLDDFIMSNEPEKDIHGRALERLFLESLKYIRSYDSISFVDAHGKEKVKVGRNGRVSTYRDVSGSALFGKIKNGRPGTIHAGVPSRDEEGQVVFSIGINKIDPDIGKFGGAIIVQYNLRDFIAYLDKIQIFGENTTWLFDQDWRVLKEPESNYRLDPRPHFSYELEPASRLVQMNAGLLVYRDLMLLPYTPFLRLAISVPSALLLQDMKDVLRFFFIVFIASLCVISLIAYWLAKYLSRPIVELAGAAERISSGGLLSSVKVKAIGEVQTLVDSFNQMTENLKKTTVSRDYVDNIINSMMDTLIVTSREGRIMRVNHATGQMLGCEERDLVGRSIDEIIPQPPEKDPWLESVIEKGAISASEKIYLARDGRRIPVLFSASALHYSGSIAGVVCVAQDISDRKHAEAQLKSYSEDLAEINEELKNFAYIVSHDLRAPLVNVKGFSQELARSLKEIEPCFQKHFPLLDPQDREKIGPVLRKDVPEALMFIASSVTRMDNLIGSILKLSRAGRRKLNPEPIETGRLVRSILDTLAHQIESQCISVTVGQLPPIVADKAAIEQIFGNLLDNAIKYLDAGRCGEIAITGDERGDAVLFQVRDNGRGMAPEDIPKAFEIFRRVGKQDVPGEGMGLAYVKTLVRLLGGHITCESALGNGTTFSFSIPAVSKAGTESVSENDAERS